MKISNVTLDDILKYAKAGGHEGIDAKTGYELNDIEHTYAEFLYDIDCELSGNGVGDYNVINKNKLNIKEKDLGYIKGYIESQISYILNEYMKKYNINTSSLRTGKLEVDLTNCSSLSIFVIQHLLRINGYEIATNPNVTTKDINFNINRPNKCTLPIRKLTSALDEKRIKRSLDENNIRGKSYLEEHLNKIKLSSAR